MSTSHGFDHARAAERHDGNAVSVNERAATAERRDGDSYARGIGTLILPDGKQIAVSQEEPSLLLNNVLGREVLAQYEEMTMPIDPPEVEMPEADYLKTADLKNQVCLILPVEAREEPGTKPGRDGVIRPWRFVECAVATLDRAGIVKMDTHLRISWTQPYLALEAAMADSPGMVIAGRFTQEEGGNAVLLQSLSGKAREVAGLAEAEFLVQVNASGEAAAGESFDEEPF